MPGKQEQEGVVLLHGIARTARSCRRMQQELERAGYLTLNLDYPSRRLSLQQLVDSIHSGIEPFAHAIPGPLHFVTHSMGGLLARAYLAQHPSLQVGRLVMLGPPNGGSEIADLLKDFGLYRAFYGPAGQQLTTIRDAATAALLAPLHCEIGVIAGNRTLDPIASRFVLPTPNDGRVSVQSTRLDGMSDHIVVRASHTLLMRNATAIAQTKRFLRDGCFIR